MRPSLPLLASVSLAPLILPGIIRVAQAGQTFVDLSGVDFQHQEGDLAYDLFIEAPEECRVNLTNPNTTCVPFSTLIGGAFEPVQVPCGVCATMEEYAAGETIEVGQIDVVGLLYFPPGMNMTLITSGIVVQGKVVMEQNQPIDGIPEITIELKGDEEMTWDPQGWNGEACIDYDTGYESCRLGKRGIIAAGGSFDIQAFPTDECPTWTKLYDIIPRAPPAPDTYPEVTPPPENCNAIIFNEGFSNGQGDFTASLGATISTDTEDSFDGTPYVTVSDRQRNWQGVQIDITGNDFVDCLRVNTTYLLQITVKLDSHNEDPSICSQLGQNCPSFRSHYLYENQRLFWKTHFVANLGARVDDGTWADYGVEVTFSEEDISNLNTYNTMYISGPEAGVDISVSQVSIRLPTEEFFPVQPDPNDPFDSMCNSIIINGDAEASDTFPYPSYLRGGLSSHLWVKQENVTADDGTSSINNYFALRGRELTFESIESALLTECIEPNAIYTFSARVRVHSLEPTKVRFTIKTKVDDSPMLIESVGYCPDADVHTGWVNCERNFLFTEEHVGAEYIQFIFVVDEDEESDIDYDDVAVTLAYTPVTGIILDTPDIEGCWDAGAQAIVTSHTILPEDTDVINITSVTLNPVTNKTDVRFETPIPLHTTILDEPWYAVEVALLSRNVLIKPQEDVEILDPTMGGHMMILHTPDQCQKIEGIELRGMGQQGVLGRYPLHFHMSENVEGSYIAKNTVRDSHQRCYVLHGTHNVTLYENIAYNTFGHCYMIEDGFEQDNTFERNLGALTKTMPLDGLLSIAESDHLAATFWISNPNNHFRHNVCAGGEDTGFWYEFLTLVRGPSAEFDPYYEVNPSEFKFGSFYGNIIHSYKGDGFKLYPNGYFPSEHAPFEDMISFRNAGDGVLLHNSAKLWIKGGIYADNRVQVEVDKQADDVWVTDGIMVGYSESFRRTVEASNTKSHCPATRPNVGLQLHSYLRFRDSHGYVIRNITFDQFGEDVTGCLGSVGIDLDPESRDGHFDAYSSFQDLYFPENTPDEAKISICLNEEVSGLTDVVFEDWSGSLDPTGQNRPGAVVSRNGTMDAFIEDCVELEGSCALYCPGGCYRGVNFATSQAVGFLDWKIRAVDLTNETRTIAFEGYFDNQTRLDFDDCDTNALGHSINCAYMEDHYNNYIFQRRRYFTATLPKGEYRLEFIDGNGEVGWPVFIEMSWEDNVTCPQAINDETLHIHVPTPTEEECLQIIRNHDAEEGFVNHWMHAGGDVQIVSPGFNSQYAIASVTRTGAWQGPGQYVDSRCFNVGEYYEVTARVRLQHEETGNFIVCDPHEKHYMHANACPRISFRMREILGNEIGDEVVTTFVHPVAETVGPYRLEDWNLMYGVIKITEHIAKQTTIFMFVERTAPGVRIIVDDVRMGKVVRSEDDASYNRGFESGDTRFWHTIGQTDIDVVSDGHDGSSYALKSFNRQTFWASMEHELTQDTLVLGHTYSVKAKIKLEKDGSSHDCTPGLWWGLQGQEESICPTLTLRQALYNSTHSNYTDIGVTVGKWESGGWNDMYGTFEATQEILDAPAVTILWTKLAASLDLIIDDVSISEISDFGCNDLIINGGGEIDGGNPYYWKMLGAGSVDVTSDGYNSDWALHYFDRTSPYDGIRQLLDKDCIHPGAVYEVTAMVKMLDANGDAYPCDVSQTSGNERCPWISIGSQNPGGAPQHRAVGSPYPGWDESGWNLIKGHFMFFSNELAADSLFVSVTQGPPNAQYYLDDISIKVMGMPSDMPSIEPSSAPSVSIRPSSSPTISAAPTGSSMPSSAPSALSSVQPTVVASSAPSTNTTTSSSGASASAPSY